MCKQGCRNDVNLDCKPDICYDAHNISNNLKTKFDVILADPPYSNKESAELYGTGKLNYKQWTKEADKLLVNGGLLIVYHKLIMPNPNPKKYSIVKRIFIGNRIYHLPRIAIYFQKNES